MKPVVDPTSSFLALDLAKALKQIGLIDLSAEVESCYDSGVPNGGDGGGNLVLVTTVNPSGLGPGDHIVLSGTLYDGDREVEPVDAVSFYILNVAFTAPSRGGAWSPVV